MFKNELGEDSLIPKFIHLKIRRRDGVESLTNLEEGEFKVPIDGCIKGSGVATQLGGMGGQFPGAPELKGPPRETTKNENEE